jgi:hypothetical protein
MVAQGGTPAGERQDSPAVTPDARTVSVISIAGFTEVALRLWLGHSERFRAARRTGDAPRIEDQKT